jgi:tetratricopeptide (TPR) repeat protein
MMQDMARFFSPRIHSWALAGSLALASCQEVDRSLPEVAAESLSTSAQAISLLGDTLFIPELAPEVREDREQRLAEAREGYEANPSDAEAIIWLGRRTAYMGDYRTAIRVYDEGIRKHPEDPRMYRHRGHRFISTRQLEQAIADLEHAASMIEGTPDEVEPDGLPNARNIPTSTLQSNIWYHLGLAHYLQGDFDKALQAYRECMEVSGNPDMLVATSHWLYMTLRRLGRDGEAHVVLEPIRPDMEIIENVAYHRLLLMYKGEVLAEELWDEAADALGSATIGYGIANWHLYNGRLPDARRALDRVLETGEWAAFGYIAAEADLARLLKSSSSETP